MVNFRQGYRGTSGPIRVASFSFVLLGKLDEDRTSFLMPPQIRVKVDLYIPITYALV